MIDLQSSRVEIKRGGRRNSHSRNQRQNQYEQCTLHREPLFQVESGTLECKQLASLCRSNRVGEGDSNWLI